MAAFLRKYGTGTGADVYVPMIKRGLVDQAVGADWTPASGDVKVSLDGGAAANIGTLPVAVAMGNGALWQFVFSNAELQCKVLTVVVSDSATKVVEDQFFTVETYGNSSAMYQADLSAANLPANVTQLLGTAWLTPGTAGTPDVNVRLISGDSVAADNLEAAADGTGYNLGGGSVVAASVTGAVGSVTGNVGGNVTGSVGSVASGGITSGSFAAGAINAAAIATDAIDADAIAADAVTEIQNGLATPTNITAGTITTVTNLTNLPSIPAGWITATGIATGAIDADALATDAVTEIANGVLGAGDSDGLTLENAIKILLASAAGKLSGAATTTIEIRAVDDSKVRITATTDSDGNRSAVTLDSTG